MRLSYKFFTLLLVLFAFSCGSKKKVAERKKAGGNTEVVQKKETISTRDKTPNSAPVTYVDKVAAYIAEFAPIAQEEMALYKIPASITLAQGILESGAGEGELTRRANNHFGIKCHGWKGGTVYHDDDRSQECFRKYNDPKYSYRDHSLFLTERKRYAALFELDINDYKGWARGLRAAGYATDRKYPDKLISLIERYHLYRYDGEVTGTEPVAYNENRTTTRQHVVQQGDTLYSIAKRYKLTVEQLKEFNNLSGNNIGIGQTLYITP
ncbi:glucosaminidase domain-containing protein [Salinimicrobium flavum]|uniref:Peptidoglycan hydrolase n=1 Tax=Salinimicrobium flavum TaxID=1737065 RepID=A0ABW5ITR7_9FLAO